MSALDNIPGLAGYLSSQQQGQSQQAQQIQTVGALQQILAQQSKAQRDQAMRDEMAKNGGDVEAALKVALRSGDFAAAQHLAPLVKLAQEQRLVAGFDPSKASPDELIAFGQKLSAAGHAGGQTYVLEGERKLKQASDAATLKTMQSQPGVQPDPQEVQQSQDYGTPPVETQPGKGGLFSSLMQSSNPQIASQATRLQDQMNKSDPRSIAPKYWQDRQDVLARLEATWTQQEQMKQMQGGNTSEFTNVQPDGKGGYIGIRKGSGRMEAIPMAPGVNAPASMDQDAVTNAAWEKLLYGKEPSGMGNATAAQRAQVRNEHARLGKELGLSPMEMAMMPQDNKVKMKAVDTLTKWGATVARSAEKLDLDLGVALDYAKKLPLGQLQFINKGVIAGQKEFNSPEANAYASAINSVRQEYARLMTGPTSNAMLPVEAMKKGNELLSTGVNVDSLTEVGNQMRRDAANTITATNHQINGLRGSIQGLGKGDYFQPPQHSSPIPTSADIDAELARRRKAVGR